LFKSSYYLYIAHIFSLHTLNSEQYDAQVANIELVDGRRGYSAGKFEMNSRLAIYSGGPHGPGTVIAYNLWIKTTQQNSEMVLVHYGSYWGNVVKNNAKDFHTLTLDHGIPTLYVSHKKKLVPATDQGLNDNKWHHISVFMPKHSCLLSEVVMAIDGERVKTRKPQIDENIFHLTGGRISIGGFGYSSNYEALFPKMTPYVGLMDDFLLYGRPVENHDLTWMTSPNYDTRFGISCNQTEVESKTRMIPHKKCKQMCSTRSWCKAYEFSKSQDGKKCLLFKGTPTFGEVKERTRCAVRLP